MGERLSGMVALVTGAGSKRGIGCACAARLAEEGASVVVTDIDPALEGHTRSGTDAVDGLGVVAEVIRGRGGRVEAYYADLTFPAEVSNLFEKAGEKFGRVDILVNNAGGSPGPAPLSQFTLEAWEKTIAINLTSTFLCSREVVPKMIGNGRGKIVNISSRAARRGAPWMHAYSAAKAGVIGLTRSMAFELAPFGVFVNAICPGDIDTELKQWGLEMEAQVKGTTVDALKEEIAGNTPLGRLGSPEDVAAVVAFLASADSDYLTGEVIDLSGGFGLGNATARPDFR